MLCPIKLAAHTYNPMFCPVCLRVCVCVRERVGVVEGVIFDACLRINSSQNILTTDMLLFRGLVSDSQCQPHDTIFLPIYFKVGTRGGVVVKALRYKPAGRGFDSRWCHWNFSVT